MTRLLASPPIDVNLGWRELNKAIPNMGIYEKTMGDKLQPSLLEILPAHLRIELSENAGSPGYMFPLATEMRKHFERTTHYFLEVKLSFEHLSRDEMVQAGIISKDDGEADVPGDAAKNDAQPVTDTLLTCLPVIDPVRGTAVSDLNPGDVLEVRIQGGIGESEFIAPYLYPPDQNAAFPILNIEKKDDERTYVLLSVNENVKGLITVSKDLRLRTLQRRTSRGTTIIINMDNIILWGTFGLAMVVTLLVFRFLFF